MSAALFSRRDFLELSALAASGAFLSPAEKVLAAQSFSTLREAAASKRMYYGTCVDPIDLNGDSAFAPAVARECNIVSTGNSTKWRSLYPAPDRWDFSGGNRICSFAETHAMSVRGHTLIWGEALPPWAIDALKAGRGAELMEEYIQTVVDCYKGRIASWDVVNEAILPFHKLENGLRKTPWLEALGPDYIDRAFRIAGQADPTVKLVYNDFFMEYDQEKANAIIALLRRMKDKNVPLHSIGIQAHLEIGKPFTPLKNFCKQAVDLGLEIVITELDVWGPPDFPSNDQRDQAVADCTREFLDIVFSVVKPKEIVTWGLTDKHSWLTNARANRRNPEGRPIRGLPLDENYTYKPMWHVLYDCFMKA